MGKAKGHYTPKQLAAMRKMMAAKLEQAARLDKAAKGIDRSIAIRDGLIPPPWAEKPLRPATERKAKGKSKPKIKKRKSYWDDEVSRVLKEKFGDDAKDLPPKVVVKTVLAALRPAVKQSGVKLTRGLILRRSGHWKS